MSFRRAVGFLLVMFGGVLPCLGQSRSVTPPSFSIAGAVRDGYDQHKMAGVRVDLKESTGAPLNTAQTRGNGNFEFSGLPNGDYTIEIVLQDYEPFRTTVSVFNSARRNFSIFLYRPATLAGPRYRWSASVHELSAPRKAHDEFEKGLYLLYSKSDYRGAIAQFQRAIKDFPNYYEAYTHQGNAYFNLKKIAAAEDSMRKSVELSKGRYPDALFLLAGLLNKTNRSLEAETLARQGVAVTPASWYGHFELARALSLLKRPEEAERNAVQARDLNPDYPQIYLLLAYIHIQRNDYAALVNDLDGYLRRAPAGPEADQARRDREILLAKIQKTRAQPQSNQQSQSNGPEQPRSNE